MHERGAKRMMCWLIFVLKNRWIDWMSQSINLVRNWKVFWLIVRGWRRWDHFREGGRGLSHRIHRGDPPTLIIRIQINNKSRKLERKITKRKIILYHWKLEKVIRRRAWMGELHQIGLTRLTTKKILREMEPQFQGVSTYRWLLQSTMTAASPWYTKSK